jgi:hypothetical protein
MAATIPTALASANTTIARSSHRPIRRARAGERAGWQLAHYYKDDFIGIFVP